MQEEFSLTRTIDEWLAGRPAATRRAYRHDVQEFLAALGGDLGRLDEPAIRRWLATFDHRRLAQATARRKLAAVRSFLRFLHQRGLVAHDLTRAVPTTLQVTESPVPIVRSTERGRLLAASLRVADPRLQLLLWLAGCGCPLPVVARLRWRDLHPYDGEGIAVCSDEQNRLLRCVIPGMIWRSLQPLLAKEHPDAPVFQSSDGSAARPEDLAEAIGWVLDETADSRLGAERDRDRLLTLTEIARRLGLPETTVRYYRDRFAPYLPAVGSGRARRYPQQTVERLRWIVEQLRAGASPHEIEAQLRSAPPDLATHAPAADAQLTDSVGRLSQRIRELTESLQRLSQILSELRSIAPDK
ncbi:site-specific integrase [Thermomicrobium sp. 4228-Ro]|uniref:site-specific integrase n=1 Tax=Thermomicrobium sp. 4228-Ro TaxID=2993937 RepID=UPI002248FD00|nr:site-specific integrase [Thermomicrobium sp. 4228-Ro]MCX2726797.1 site-specific integrase [Thermomicrobium sp. 4228-Ro]